MLAGNDNHKLAWSAMRLGPLYLIPPWTCVRAFNFMEALWIAMDSFLCANGYLPARPSRPKRLDYRGHVEQWSGGPGGLVELSRTKLTLYA